MKSLTIDELEFPARVSVVKMDIQGSELAALRGAVNMISASQPTIIFEFEQLFVEEFHHVFQDYIDFFNVIDYRFAEVTANNFVVVPVRKLEEWRESGQLFGKIKRVPEESFLLRCMVPPRTVS